MDRGIPVKQHMTERPVKMVRCRVTGKPKAKRLRGSVKVVSFSKRRETKSMK
jgi:hypothetical protein